MKFKVLLVKFKYELLIFALLLTQAGLRLDWHQPVRIDYLTLYLLDFKVGYGSRMFIGSIVDLLTNKVMTEKWLIGFILASFVLTYFILALLLGKLIRSVNGDLRNSILVLTAVFIFAGFSVMVLIQYIGLLDIYWFLFSLIAVVAMRNRITRWLVPLLCVMGLATHYGFAMTFMPFILGLLLYEMYKSKFKKSSIFLAVTGLITMIGASVYFAVFANNFLKLDSNGTFKYLSSKVSFPVWRYYYEAYLFYSDANKGISYNSFGDVIKVLISNAFADIRVMNYVASLLFMLPLLILFFLIWKNAVKLCSSKAEKAFMLFCMALPVPTLPAFIISTDMERFLGEIIIVQFCMLFYLVYDKNEAVISSLKKAENFFRKYPLLLILLLIFSFSAYFIK